MAFCQCKEQSLKRQNNSCYSDPSFPEADALSKDAQSVQPCGLGFFSVIILPPKNVKMYEYLCICTEWMCGHVHMYLYTYSHGVKSCSCWSELDHDFHSGALLFHLDRRKRMSFCRNSMLLNGIDPVGQKMACNTSRKFRVLNSCVLIHTHTVHSSMHTDKGMQKTSLLLSYGRTVHLYRFKEIYANNFTYSINAFRC